MLFIKICRAKSGVVLLALSLAIAGCTPPGPRAVLKGKKLLDHGRLPEAITQLKLAVSILPTNAPAWNYLGLAYHQSGQASNAVQAYQRALTINHDLAEARYNLGCLWLEQGRIDAAKGELTAYTALRRYSPEGWVKLGAAQLRSARAEIRSADLVAAEKSFTEALRLNANNAEALNGLGLVHMQRNRPRDAAQWFEAALKKQSNYPPALLNLAIVQQQHLKNRPAALQRYREYLAASPAGADAESINTLVRELDREVNGTQRAAAVATASPSAAAPAASPKSDPSPPAVANAAPTPSAVRPEIVSNSPAPVAVVSRPPAAETPRTQPPAKPPATAAAVAPSNTVADTAPPERRPIQRSASRPAPSPEPAVSETRPAATVIEHANNGGFPRYRYQSPAKPGEGDRAAAQSAFSEGVSAQRENRLADAINAYRRAMQLDPAYFEAAYNLGLAAAGSGKLPQALAAYEMALAIRPESLDARYNFAWALKQSNFVIDAANELEKILSAYPTEPRAHLALGNIYAQQWRQPAKAREHYLKVLENDPRNPQGPAIRNWLASH